MTNLAYGTVQSESLIANKLLAALPDGEREILEQHATFVTLKRRDVLYETEKPTEAVYFLTDGIASLLSVMADGTAVETATIGREGMVGLSIFHGVPVTSEQAMVQVPGKAYRVSATDFQRIIPSMPTLDTLLHRFSVVMFTLAAQNSGCNRKHSIEQRCCRWLLMVADRLDRCTFDLTHDFIAQMLGVRRASVTETLGSLERRGLVQTSRGRITIVNRAGLEACVCECYAIIRGAVQRVLDGRAHVSPTSPLAGVKASEDGKSTLGAPHD
jgi:CRP-like cAMP-binding protein